MIVSDTAVKKSVTVVVLAVLIMVFGTYCYLVLPRESDPDISIPNVFISTEYRGVSPTDIETAITIEIEKKLKGLDGLKKIQSISAGGLSSINVEFVTGTDIDQAMQDVKDKVDEAKNELPQDLENDPSVFEVNFSELPIVVFSLSGTCGLPCLKEIADDLEDAVEAIPGILAVDVTGGLEREIRVEVFPEKLAYYGLDISALQQVVVSENQNTSGGVIRMGDGRFQLRVPGKFTTPEEIYGLIVRTHGAEPIYLKDVALLLIFLILVSQFNSISQPFIIMTSVILSLGGAFLGLMLFRQPFGIIMTGVGVISLAGVVVNNAIVLLDYTNKLRERGMVLSEAVVAAGATRLRPVMLTAITTILGLIPMVTGVSFDFHDLSISLVSESSQWWRSMAVVVIFGLLVATFLTLVVVPTLYYLLEQLPEKRRQAVIRLKRFYWQQYGRLSGEKNPNRD